MLGVTVKVLSRMLMTGRALQGYRGRKRGGKGLSIVPLAELSL